MEEPIIVYLRFIVYTYSYTIHIQSVLGIIYHIHNPMNPLSCNPNNEQPNDTRHHQFYFSMMSILPWISIWNVKLRLLCLSVLCVLNMGVFVFLHHCFHQFSLCICLYTLYLYIERERKRKIEREKLIRQVLNSNGIMKSNHLLLQIYLCSLEHLGGIGMNIYVMKSKMSQRCQKFVLIGGKQNISCCIFETIACLFHIN